MWLRERREATIAKKEKMVCLDAQAPKVSSLLRVSRGRARLREKKLLDEEAYERKKKGRYTSRKTRAREIQIPAPQNEKKKTKDKKK